MADRRRDVYSVPQHSVAQHSVVSSDAGERSGAAWGDYHRASPLTASAQILPFSDMYGLGNQLHSELWQDEAWDFYDSLGEFNYGVEWFSEALSRVRLTAAEMQPGGDEPRPLTEGPAAELMESFAGGTDAQAAVLRSLGIQLSVAGEAYFVGREVTDAERYGDTVLDAEPDEDGRIWTVQAKDTMRRSQRSIKTFLGRKRRGWELQTDETNWITLPRESLVCRVWDRNERLPWLARSPAKSALSVMREIDMYNRYIMATLISRVALNGLLLVPDEVTLPSNPEYEDAADPFMAELIDVMRATIKNPGAPSSAAPLPIRGPAEFLEKIKHLTFSTPLDSRIFEMREGAIKRLASALNLPMEVILGMGTTSHWNAWQISEDAIKIHIAPKIEIITRCLTRSYLHPMLKALGESMITPSGGRLLVWYDTSSLTQRPDRSDLALQLRDRLIINDSATRRETGFNEDDAASDDELEGMVFRSLATNPFTYAVALKQLTGLEVEQAPIGSLQQYRAQKEEAAANDAPSAPGNEPVREPPSTRAEAPPPPDDGITASAADRRKALITRVQRTNGAAQLSAMTTLIAHDVREKAATAREHVDAR